jgi:hypothetical protein
MRTFYLGTDMPGWLGKVGVPLFVSRRRLEPYRTMPIAIAPWALDSGGFTELSMHGRWVTTVPDYVTTVRRCHDEIGLMQFAAPMDAMCEPWILEQSKSWLGGTVGAHQRWTTDNFLELRTLAEDLPFIPVIQGWEMDDYLRHVDQYAAAGVDLTLEPTVGIGSVCRRQASDEIAVIIARLAVDGLRLHGFGVKADGIRKYGWLLDSADSMAWSFGGRQIRPCPVRQVASCAHCVHHALAWRDAVLSQCHQRQPVQLTLTAL